MGRSPPAGTRGRSPSGLRREETGKIRESTAVTWGILIFLLSSVEGLHAAQHLPSACTWVAVGLD